MDRPQKLLGLVIGLEILALAFLRAWPAKEAPTSFPRLDALEPATAAEIRKLEAALRREDPPSWLRLAEVYRAFGVLPAADYCYQQIDRLAPQDTGYLFDWAATLSRMGETKAAGEQFQRALQRGVAPTNDCLWLLAKDRLREENAGAAEAILRPMDRPPEATVAYCRLLIRTGRAREATFLSDGLLQQMPDELRVQQMKSWAEAELGSVAEAYRHRMIALRCRDRSPRKGLITERDELIRQQFDGARLAAQSLPGGVQAKPEETMAFLRLALGRRWREDQAWQLARLELQAGHALKAIEIADECMEQVGATGEGLNLIGQAWLGLNDPDRALAAFLKAEQLGANRSAIDRLNLLQNLIRVYEQRGNQAAAKQRRAQVQFELGKRSWLDNNPAQARQLFRQAVALAEDHPNAWFYLGETSALLGDQTAARNALERCLKLNPHHGRALDRLARLNP